MSFAIGFQSNVHLFKKLVLDFAYLDTLANHARNNTFLECVSSPYNKNTEFNHFSHHIHLDFHVLPFHDLTPWKRYQLECVPSPYNKNNEFNHFSYHVHLDFHVLLFHDLTP